MAKKGKNILCANCGKESYKYPRDLRKGMKNLFCGMRCSGDFKKGKSVVNAGTFKKGMIPWSKGLRIVREKHSGDFSKGHVPWNKGLKGFRAGHLNNHWKGGISKIAVTVRGSFVYKKWRTAVFERDGYRCVWCFDNKGGNLNADHIKPFSIIMSENQIRTLEEAEACVELWDLGNARTLCEPCHRTTDTYLSLKVRKASKGY